MFEASHPLSTYVLFSLYVSGASRRGTRFQGNVLSTKPYHVEINGGS